MPPRVSLILPVHNQADHIAKVVRGYAASLERLGSDHEIILVPNGSSDDSDAICTGLAAELSAVRCIEIEGRGWGRAVRSGISAAHGDIICYTNAARTQPDDIRRVIDLSLRNSETVVKAVRMARHGHVRRVGAFLYNALCAWLFDLRAADVNGTPKAFPRSVTCLRTLTRDDDLIDLEFMWRCRRDGLTVTEVPIYADARHGGKSTTSWKTAWKLYTGAIRFWYHIRTEGRSP